MDHNRSVRRKYDPLGDPLGGRALESDKVQYHSKYLSLCQHSASRAGIITEAMVKIPPTGDIFVGLRQEAKAGDITTQ